MNPSESFARYSMAGWVFVVVLVASLAFSSDQHAWTALTKWLSGVAATNQAASGIAVAAFGIIAGVSAPPALGYVLARAAAGLFENLNFYVCHWHDHAELDRVHAIFYSRAAQNLITWRDGRTMQVYASLSCALAGIAACLVAASAYHAWSFGVPATTAILAVFLIADALYDNRQRSAVVKEWQELPESKDPSIQTK
jgi:hypothetical protein